MSPLYPWAVYRTIVLDEPVRKFVDHESSKANRFEDQWDGVVWHLARKPEKGLPRYPQNPDKYLLHIFAANPLGSTRELWVLYSYNQNEVQIHAIRFGP